MENIEETMVDGIAPEVEETEEIIERPYTLRKMKDGDLFPLLGLFRKLGLNDFKDVIFKAANGGSAAEIGVATVLNMADVVISKLESDPGQDIYRFYASLSGLTVEGIKEMEFGTLPLMVYDSFNEVKNTSFFKVLSKLL